MELSGLPLHQEYSPSPSDRGIVSTPILAGSFSFFGLPPAKTFFTAGTAQESRSLLLPASLLIQYPGDTKADEQHKKILKHLKGHVGECEKIELASGNSIYHRWSFDEAFVELVTSTEDQKTEIFVKGPFNCNIEEPPAEIGERPWNELDVFSFKFCISGISNRNGSLHSKTHVAFTPDHWLKNVSSKKSFTLWNAKETGWLGIAMGPLMYVFQKKDIVDIKSKPDFSDRPPTSDRELVISTTQNKEQWSVWLTDEENTEVSAQIKKLWGVSVTYEK